MAAEIDYSRFVSIEDKNPQWERMNRTAIEWYLASNDSMKLKYRNMLFEDLYNYYGIIGDNFSERLFEDDEKPQKLTDDDWPDDEFANKSKTKPDFYSNARAHKEDREKEIMAFLCGMDGSTYVPLEHFNPEEYTFSHYYHIKRKNLAIDIHRKESGAYQKKLSDDERRQRQEEKTRNGDSSPVPESAFIYPDTKTSIDEYEQILETDEENTAARGVQLRTVEDDVSYSEEIEYKISLLIAAALDIKSILGAKSGNPIRCTYYKMFFTSDISRAIRETSCLSYYTKQQTNLFKAVLTGFLDFTLVDICRTVLQIHTSHLKQYFEMVPGTEGKMTVNAKGEEKLEADVYYTYLQTCEGIETASSVSVSNNRKTYDNDFVRLALKEDDI